MPWEEIEAKLPDMIKGNPLLLPIFKAQIQAMQADPEAMKEKMA